MAPLTQREYEQLRDATATYREELVVRLCGEVGLRATELAALRPKAIDDERDVPGLFISVGDGDTTRTVYAPEAVANDLEKYVQSNDVAASAPIFDVSPRRLQMLVERVADRAAEQTGRAVFDTVTPSVLRRSFGRRLLVDAGVDARVVATVGGWDRIGTLLDGTDDPSPATIAAAMEPTAKPDTSDRLSLVTTAVAAIDDALLRAVDRAAIDDAVCDGLADVYPAVWVLSTATNPVERRAHAGDTPDRFAGAGSTELVRRAAQTGRTMVGPDDPGPASDSDGAGLLAAAPIVGDDVAEAVLVVRSEAQNAFDDTERTILTGLARRIALAEAALRRKQLLVGDTTLAVEFAYEDGPLSTLSATTGCSARLDGVVPGSDGHLVIYASVTDVEPAAVLAAAGSTEGIDRVRLVQRTTAGGVVELVLDSSPLLVLIDRGGAVIGCRVEAGQVQLEANVPQGTDLRGLQSSLAAVAPSISLERKQQRQTTGTVPSPSGLLDGELTDRQRSVLEGAYRAGYFEWPRESTAEDLAAAMDVSPPTLHNHLRKAQNALFTPLFEDDH